MDFLSPERLARMENRAIQEAERDLRLYQDKYEEANPGRSQAYAYNKRAAARNRLNELERELGFPLTTWGSDELEAAKAKEQTALLWALANEGSDTAAELLRKAREERKRIEALEPDRAS